MFERQREMEDERRQEEQLRRQLDADKRQMELEQKTILDRKVPIERHSPQSQ